jgi:hypothetical protein
MPKGNLDISLEKMGCISFRERFEQLERLERLERGEIGAGDGDRTHDVQLGKLAFYR